MIGNRTFYEVLGVTPEAPQEEIRKAYRKKSLETHPDRPGGSKQRFQEIQEAYEFLRNEESRKAYYQELADKVQKAEEARLRAQQRSQQFEDLFGDAFSPPPPPKQAAPPKPPPPPPPQSPSQPQPSSQPSAASGSSGSAAVGASRAFWASLFGITDDIGHALVGIVAWVGLGIYFTLFAFIGNIWVSVWVNQIFHIENTDQFPLTLWLWMSIGFGFIGSAIYLSFEAGLEDSLRAAAVLVALGLIVMGSIYGPSIAKNIWKNAHTASSPGRSAAADPKAPSIIAYSGGTEIPNGSRVYPESPITFQIGGLTKNKIHTLRRLGYKLKVYDSLNTLGQSVTDPTLNISNAFGTVPDTKGWWIIRLQLYGHHTKKIVYSLLLQIV